MEISGQRVGHVVRLACDVIEARDVAVEPLVHAEQAEEVGGWRVAGGAALTLPERGVQVVSLADDDASANVKRLCDGFKVNEAPCQLQVRVCDCTLGIFVGDEATRDEGGSLEAPE